MRNVLIVDVETTGLDPAKDVVIEVAAMLYSLEHTTVLESISSLARSETGNAAEAINRIPAAALVQAPPAAVVVEAMVGMACRGEAHAILAHNADFDRSFLWSFLGKPGFGFHLVTPWVCTKADIAWPCQQKQGESLVTLALAHDLGVATAHRAMADCDLIARLLTRSRQIGADIDAMIARGLRPKAEFIAVVPFERKDEAKAAGFAWDGVKREWRRTMAIEDTSALPFPTRKVNAA